MRSPKSLARQLDFIPCGKICCVWSAKPRSSARPKCMGLAGSLILGVIERRSFDAAR